MIIGYYGYYGCWVFTSTKFLRTKVQDPTLTHNYLYPSGPIQTPELKHTYLNIVTDIYT